MNKIIKKIYGKRIYNKYGLLFLKLQLLYGNIYNVHMKAA